MTAFLSIDMQTGEANRYVSLVRGQRKHTDTFQFTNWHLFRAKQAVLDPAYIEQLRVGKTRGLAVGDIIPQGAA